MKFIGKYYCDNGNFLPLQGDELAALQQQPFVYEVARVLGRKLMFWDGHWQRLQQSLGKMGWTLYENSAKIEQAIQQLLEHNALQNNNIMLAILPTEQGNRWALFALESHYPTPAMYTQGVEVDLLAFERPDPQAKVMHANHRSMYDQLLAQSGKYELLLTDAQGRITEGSRSNVFFVRGTALFTAPPALILSGVTRQKVIHTAIDSGIQVYENAAFTHEIDKFDAAFLTGTSPLILPIRSIGAQRYTIPLVVRQLMENFHKEILKNN